MSLPPGYRIRASQQPDLARLGAVETAAAALFASIGLGWIAQAPPLPLPLLAEAHEGGLLWIAADEADQPVGFAVAQFRDGDFHLAELSVAQPHQGQGLGAALLQAVVDGARWRFEPAIVLTTYRDVPWNAPFYARHGFVELRADALSPALLRQLAHESAQGHDPSRRCAMVQRL